MKNILILEDSKIINNSINDVLTNKGYTCYQSFLIQDGLEIVQKNSIDYVILDLNLPDGIGEDFLQATENRSFKIIVLTIENEIQHREELFHLGVLDYIVKDKNIFFSIEEILKIINRFDNTTVGDVLVVDDSKFICKQIEYILTPRDYSIDKAFNAKSALEKIAKNSYDLIILDIELPDINGVKVLEKLKSDSRTFLIPVLILSGNHSAELIRKCLKLGAIDFIRKPFILEEFILKIDMLIDNAKKDKSILSQKNKIDNFVKTLQLQIAKEVEKNEQQQLLLFAQSRHVQMGEMISMIAHQWRQPLNTISVAHQLLLHKIKKYNIPQSELSKYSENITTQIEYMSQTISQFRDFFKEDSKKTNFKIYQKIIDILKIVESSLQHSQITVNITGDLELTHISYPKEFSQALLNIINNAKDAYIQNNITENRNINIEIAKKGKSSIITIEDFAGGIENSIISKVFDPYFSTKLDKNGTGLGLYMTKLIIEDKCKGSIDVNSFNNSTKFTITLN